MNRHPEALREVYLLETKWQEVVGTKIWSKWEKWYEFGATEGVISRWDGSLRISGKPEMEFIAGADSIREENIYIFPRHFRLIARENSWGHGGEKGGNCSISQRWKTVKVKCEGFINSKKVLVIEMCHPHQLISGELRCKANMPVTDGFPFLFSQVWSSAPWKGVNKWKGFEIYLYFFGICYMCFYL